MRLGIVCFLAVGQAQEWYREEAVGRAVRLATGLAEKIPTNRGGEDDAQGGVAQEGDGSGSTDGEETAAAALKSASVALSREEVFVTTKIHPRDFGAERMGTMVDASNRNLQVSASSPLCYPGVICLLPLVV